MKRVFSTLAMRLAMCVALAPAAMVAGEASAQASNQSRSRDQVCLYEHAGYGGWEQCFGIGEAIRDLGNRRDQVSSIRVQGRAEIVLYEHPNFEGNEVILDSNVPDIKQWSRRWNDETDSFRVERAGLRGGNRGGERRADRACAYQHANYQGRSICWDAGDQEFDLKDVGWNDGISSIRTFGRTRVAVYEHDQFEGQRLIVESDIPDLSQVRAGGNSHWNDRISSLRVSGEGRLRGRD